MTRAEQIMEEVEEQFRISSNMPLEQQFFFQRLFERLDELEVEITKIREEIA